MQDSTELKLISSHPEVGNIKTFIFEAGGLGWTAGQYNTYILPQAGDTEELNQRFFTFCTTFLAAGSACVHILYRGDSGLSKVPTSIVS